MRTLIKHGLVAACLATMVACGDNEPPKDPSSMNNAPLQPAPLPESKPPVTDVTPIETTLGGDANRTPPPEVDVPAKPVEKPLTDDQIVGVTAAANAGEIDMAELAKKKAVTPDVKNYAAMMLKSHHDMETKGKTIQTKAKIMPADSDASTNLKTETQTTMTTLKDQKGKDFDKAYIDSQVKAHKEVLDLYDNKLLPNAQNGEVKTMLTDARGNVASHLAKAEEIQTKLDATPGQKTPAKGKGKPTDTTPPPKNPQGGKTTPPKNDTTAPKNDTMPPKNDTMPPKTAPNTAPTN